MNHRFSNIFFNSRDYVALGPLDSPNEYDAIDIRQNRTGMFCE